MTVSLSTVESMHTYCKPCHNVRGRETLEELGGSRTYHLKRRYGITAADADVMFEAQIGLCAICLVAPANYVDHDHSTGTVRALLCFNCNGGLGRFRDAPVVLRAAGDYVELHTARQAAPTEQAGAGGSLTTSGRAGGPPVGSDRRPGGTRARTSARHTGGIRNSRRPSAAGEADG